MTSSINEGRRETVEETASNLQKFDDDLALGDNEAVKLGSANISSDLNALNEKSSKLLASFDSEQASLQMAFMDRIQYECNSRISLSKVWGKSLLTSPKEKKEPTIASVSKDNKQISPSNDKAKGSTS